MVAGATLTAATLTAAGVGVADALVIEPARKESLALVSVWAQADEQLRPTWGAYGPVTIDLPPTPDNWPNKMITRALIPADKGKTAARLAPGLIPTVSFVDDHSVEFYPTKPDQIGQTVVAANLGGQPEQRLPYGQPGQSTLFYHTQPMNRVVLEGDSWGAWGGAIYGIGANLQMLLYLSGYNTPVLNYSAIGTNITKFSGVAETRGWDDDSAFVHLFQPDTDPTFDIWSQLFSSKAQSDGIGDEFRDFHKPLPNKPLDQRTAAAQRSTLLATREHFLPAVIKHLKNAVIGPPVKHFIYDAINNSLKKADALAPTDINGGEFFNRYTKQMHHITNRERHPLMIGLPVVGLSELDARLYDAKVWPMLLEALPRQATAVNLNPRLRTGTDLLEHPTPETAFFIAQQTFGQLTGRPPDPKVIASARQAMKTRIATMKDILGRVLPGSRPDCDLLLPT